MKYAPWLAGWLLLFLVVPPADTSSIPEQRMVKILPSDFVPDNDEDSPVLIDDDGDRIWLAKAGEKQELYAFVAIPPGMQATGVAVYTSDGIEVSAWEAKLTDSREGAPRLEKGLGNVLNRFEQPVARTDDNMLVVEVAFLKEGGSLRGGHVAVEPAD